VLPSRGREFAASGGDDGGLGGQDGEAAGRRGQGEADHAGGVLAADLLDNAIRHNLPGGQAEISTALTTAGVFVSVSNTGPRIPPDAVEDLFQPFRQLGVQRTLHGEGHGLGLAIVRAIADAHGAALTARARPAGGLDIKVTFPLAAAAQPASAADTTEQLTNVSSIKHTDLVT